MNSDALSEVHDATAQTPSRKRLTVAGTSFLLPGNAAWQALVRDYDVTFELAGFPTIQAITGGIPFPRLKGTIPVGQPTPRRDLGLRPGDLVRVKSYAEILATLDVRLSNRGLRFDAELVPFCGKVFRVSTCVERFVDEKTGQMRTMKTPAA